MQDENTQAYEAVKAYCLGMLARREHSQKELLTKCSLKGFKKILSREVLDDLAEQGWQSDSRYAAGYAASRIQKGYGPVAIAYDLAQQGIDDFDLDDIISSEAGNWLAVLERVYVKKYPNDTPLERSEWAKRSRFLMQRGFSYPLINTLCQQLNIKFL